MTYPVSVASHSEAALQIFRAGTPGLARGAASVGAVTAVRSPDPRASLTLSSGAADAIFAIVQARVHTTGSYGAARGEGWAWGEGSSWSGEATQPTHDDAPQPVHDAAKVAPVDTAKAAPHDTAAQAQVTVSMTVSVETLSVSVSGQRPPKDVRYWWENAPDARKFLDAAYQKLGEGADTPRSLDDWCTKVGLLGLSSGTLCAIADTQTLIFTPTEISAARAAIWVWDRVWGKP